MAKKYFWLGILPMVLVFGMIVIGCDDGSTSGGSNDIATVNDIYVMKMFNELKAKKSNRSVINMDGISTAYRMARVDKFVNGIGGAPDFLPMDTWNWDGVTEGNIKLDWSGANGDGLLIWVFISIQNNEPYVIYANNDAADEYAIGVTDYKDQEGQVWFFRWE
jgi:hypothetical protein